MKGNSDRRDRSADLLSVEKSRRSSSSSRHRVLGNDRKRAGYVSPSRSRSRGRSNSSSSGSDGHKKRRRRSREPEKSPSKHPKKKKKKKHKDDKSRRNRHSADDDGDQKEKHRSRSPLVSKKSKKKERERRRLKKLKKRELRELKRLVKQRNKEFRERAAEMANTSKNDSNGKERNDESEPDDTVIGPQLSSEAGPSRNMKPISKEEWEARQSVVRRVYDPETGRDRLVKGDGEILEECVSRERHAEINRRATASDGEYFQKVISSQLAS